MRPGTSLVASPGGELMLVDQVAVEPEPLGPRGSGKLEPNPPRRPTRWGLRLLVFLILVGGGGGAIYLWASAHERTRKSEVNLAAVPEHESETSSEPRVEVTQPQHGGMARTTRQPGTIRAFEFAQLYAKVSGYLDRLGVDRGSRVKKDQLLAHIFDPELDAAVVQAQAALERVEAAVEQAKEHVNVALAFQRAAEARKKKADADLESAVATRTYRDLALKRMTELVRRNAVEQRLVEESEEEYHASVAAEDAATAGIKTAEAEVKEAEARVLQARADLVGAQAEVKVKQADLAKAKVYQDYTKITSPYDGVIIQRGEAVHKGAFIQAATQNLGDQPMLTVAWDDVMRTIILVPDDDVPYCDIGDPVIITLDALRGRAFKGTVSRMAESEDLHDRNMRVEVDLPNPDHILKDGMFGRAEILLEKETTHLTVPSSCVIDKNDQGQGAVLVVQDGKIHHQRVQVGRDSGIRAEILSGLDPKAQVVLKPDAAMAEGTPVRVEAVTTPVPGTQPESAPTALKAAEADHSAPH